MGHYLICGYKIEIYDPPRPPCPYKLVIHWRHGVDQVYATGHSPVCVREFEQNIARNARVIDKITLQDSSGVLEAIWNREWEISR